MDSLTQIALGAAVGEAVLGKKVGNRAMLWGAIGGTIPDLDIIANLFTDEITALAFHRGISHSFLFAVLAPLALGWAADQLYKSGLYRKKGYKLFVMIGGISFYSLLALGINVIPVLAGGEASLGMISGSVLLGLGLVIWIWKSYYEPDSAVVEASWRDWAWLLFWAIFTHPLLDCCTAYGTQVFQPFSDYRVAFNNISVVDPIYTLPLVLALVIAARLFRHHVWRRRLNYLGLALSTAYLLFGFYNKSKVNQVFEVTLAERQIDYHRYTTSPTIFNNVLWNCLAEGDTAYYYGHYSLNDREPKVAILNVFPKNHELIAEHEAEYNIQTLKWFTNNYYSIIRNEEGNLQLNDLRFGLFGDEVTSSKDYVFRFILEEKDGKLTARQVRGADRSIGEVFSQLWERIKGI
ncbi:MAG: metal-dependent hydrolase [Bacteroidota bacterium]